MVTEDGKKILVSAFGSGAPTGRPGLGAAAGGAPPLAPDVAVACQKVSFGAVQAELQDGCFLGATAGRAKVSTGPLRLNGLEIIPDAGVQVIVDPVRRTIRSTGNVRVLLRAPGVPDITLFRGSIQIDASGKGVGESLIKWGEGLFKPNLLGFGLSGDIDVRLTNGGVRIPVSVQLPKAFGNVRGAAELVADNRRGLVVDSLDFSADGVPLGPVMLRRLQVQYRATGGTAVGDCLKPATSGASSLPNEWAGVFELELPPPQTGPAVCGSIRFGDGAFRAATFSIRLPYPGIVLFPGVSLTTLGGGLSLTPAEISAAATFGIIPAGSGGLVTLNARIDVRIDDPFIIRGAADVSTAGVEIGSGSFDPLQRRLRPHRPQRRSQDRPGQRAGGHRRLRRRAARGVSSVAGGRCASPTSARRAPRRWCPRRASRPACRSSRARRRLRVGLAADRRGQDLALLLLRERLRGGDARAAAFEDAVPEAGATVAAGVPDVTFRVAGEGGVPAVDLIGPSGAPVAPTATVADPAGILYLGVTGPPAGTWTVRARAGSPLIAEVTTSSSVPPPKVAQARVTGARRARVLRYRATIGEGQAITFVERGRAGTRVLGAAKAGSGRLGFVPAPGPGGRREIVALLTQNGLVVQEVTVTRYAAPPPPRLGRATGLRLRRSGARAVATWRPGSAAAAQRFEALIAGGQRVTKLLGPGARRAVIPGVNGRRVSVSVIALARDGHSGRPARASLAPGGRR